MFLSNERIQNTRPTLRLPFHTFGCRAPPYHRLHVWPPNRAGVTITTEFPSDDDDTLFLPSASCLRSRARASASAGLGLQLTFALSEHAAPSCAGAARRQRDPRVHKPGVIPRATRLAPRRRRHVHVRDMPTVPDDRARVRGPRAGEEGPR